MGIDLALVQTLQQWMNTPFLQAFAAFAARWLIFGVLLTSLVAAFVERGAVRRHAWKETWWSIGIAFVLALILSTIIERTRPFLAAHTITSLIPSPASAYSFPSAHSAVIWAWAANVTQLERSWAALWALVALLVSLSRVMVGVHFLSDVLAGALVGILAWGIVRAGHRRTRTLIETPAL